MSSSSAASASALVLVLRRDRSLVTAGLFLVAGLAWIYMLHLAVGMDDMEMGAEMTMPQTQVWDVTDFFFMFVMWSVMMVAMMVPSASPMVLLYAKLTRKRRERDAPYTPTTFFLAGYLLMWTGFSAAATLAQWALHNNALLTPMGVSTSASFGAVLLFAAGVFQLTPLKKACLVHCRSPLHFFMQEWKEGKWGSLAMGAKHGNYCVGCCWVLMALLFVAGVMNLLWVAAITVFVLVERVVPGGEVVGRLAGIVLMAAGIWVLALGGWTGA